MQKGASASAQAIGLGVDTAQKLVFRLQTSMQQPATMENPEHTEKPTVTDCGFSAPSLGQDNEMPISNRT